MDLRLFRFPFGLTDCLFGLTGLGGVIWLFVGWGYILQVTEGEVRALGGLRVGDVGTLARVGGSAVNSKRPLDSDSTAAVQRTRARVGLADMSAMVNPSSLEPETVEAVEACSACDSDREPLWWVCDYHEGFDVGVAMMRERSS